MRRIIIAGALAVLLAGCAGTDFTYDQARKVQVGMTEAQVTQLMGQPYQVVSRGDEQMWVWSQANAFKGARAVSFKMKDGRVVEVPAIPANFR